MVSQFVSSHQVRLLGHLDFTFPEGTHAIGRLDNHSEGLLILTTNKKVTRLLFQGTEPHKRTYLVYVKYAVSPQTLLALQTGVHIPVSNGGTYLTAPAEVEIIPKPTQFLAGPPGEKEYIPHTWLKMSLTEGKFHQVRKMVGAVRHKCLRLIRVAIEDLQLGDLPPGAVLEMDETTFFQKLRIPYPGSAV